MNQFVMTKQSSIILYGAGSNGFLTKRLYEKKGFKILGMIDKRANELVGTDNISSPESLFSGNFSRNSIVIITVKNVFCHSEIAENLVRNGYFNIIYKPYNSLMNMGDEAEDLISKIYDKVIKHVPNGPISIPATENIRDLELKDYAFIKKDDNFIYAYVPIINIYTDIQKEMNSPWMNANVLTQFPHINLFNYFQNKQGGIKDYIDFCVEGAENAGNKNLTESWKLNIINNRYDVFQHMNNSFNIDYNFFIRTAPESKYNPKKDVFNLLGGKHRVTYLISKGQNFIPLKIREEDYANWLNKLNELNIPEFKHMVIEHPFFYKKLSKNFEFYMNFLKTFIIQTAKEEFKNKNKLNFEGVNFYIDMNDHFLGRCLYRMGANITYKSSNNLDNLLVGNVNNEKVINEKVDYIITECSNIPTFDSKNIIIFTNINRQIENYSFAKVLSFGILNELPCSAMHFIKKEEI